MRIECKNCGGAHPTWDCKRPAKKWLVDSPSPEMYAQEGKSRENAVKPNPPAPSSTASRKDVTRRLMNAPERSGDAASSRVSDKRTLTPPLGTEGTQDPPVDTNSSPRLLKGSSGIGLASPAKVQDAEAANTKDAVILKPGRPSTGFDKAAYNRQYMRDHRAKIKASKDRSIS